MMLELRNICKTYTQGKLDVPVLKDISLSVEEGEYVAIMGPSGSGKTTLMNIIGCLDSPTSGEYFLEGKDISQNSDAKMSEVRLHSIGFVFQSFYLLSRQTALENVALPLLYAGVRRKERLEIARRALERVGLGDRVNFKPTQLSGGQCQRVAIARAIVNEPKILLADEPTGALDTKSGQQIMEIFQRLNDEGVTIVMITHEQEVAAQARRVLHIRDGRLLEAQPAKNDGPAMPPDMIPPGDFHIGPAKKEPEAPEKPAPQPEEPKAPVKPAPQPEEPKAPVKPAPQPEEPKAPVAPLPVRRPRPPREERAAGGPSKPRHGNWTAPAPQPAPRRPVEEPSPLEMTVGTALLAEIGQLLEGKEPSPPAPKKRPAPAAETAAPAKAPAQPAAPTGSFGAAIPTDLGTQFPFGRKPRGGKPLTQY